MTQPEIIGGFAFPTTKPLDSWGDPNQGMTLRDYFAAKAMQGLVAANWCADLRNDHYGESTGNSTVARDAYMIADAMLEARK
jgi:hypothetical protein